MEWSLAVDPPGLVPARGRSLLASGAGGRVHDSRGGADRWPWSWRWISHGEVRASTVPDRGWPRPAGAVARPCCSGRDRSPRIATSRARSRRPTDRRGGADVVGRGRHPRWSRQRAGHVRRHGRLAGSCTDVAKPLPSPANRSTGLRAGCCPTDQVVGRRSCAVWRPLPGLLMRTGLLGQRPSGISSDLPGSGIGSFVETSGRWWELSRPGTCAWPGSPARTSGPCSPYRLPVRRRLLRPFGRVEGRRSARVAQRVRWSR